MLRPIECRLLVLYVLLTVAATGVQAQDAATPVAGQETAWRPVWFIGGPIQSQVSPETPDNELRIRDDQIVLSLADGQQWPMPLASLQRIRYFRQFERPPVIVGNESAWFPNPAAFFRNTNHFVDLVFSDEGNEEIILTLRLDKAVYRPAIATLHRLTAKPVLVSPDDIKSLPAMVRTHLTSDKRVASPRAPAMGGSVPLNIALNADGRTLAAVLRDGSVQVWDTGSGLAQRRWPAVGTYGPDWRQTARIAFRPGGPFVAVSSQGTGIKQWDVRTGVRRDVVIPTSSDDFDVPFWFSPDGSTLIVASEFQGFSCWDPETGTRSDCLRAHNVSLQQAVGGVTRINARAAAFSADGTRLALTANAIADGRTQGVLTVLEWPSTRVVQQRLERPVQGVAELRFAGTDRVIERQGWNFVRVSQLASPLPARIWDLTTPFRYDAAALSDHLIAVGGRDSELLLYSAVTGRLEGRLATGVWVSTAAFLPGGRLAVGTVAGTVQIWDAKSRGIVRVLSPGRPEASVVPRR